MNVFLKEKEPSCLRALYGHDNTKNGLHGSDGPFSAHREIKFMFPDSEPHSFHCVHYC